MKALRLLVIMLLWVVSAYAAKPDTVGLRQAVNKLNEVLISRDTAVLKKMLHKKLSYGHSNGWVERKKDVLKHLYDGKLVYQEIRQQALELITEGDFATVRTNADIKVLLDGAPIEMKLHILQVWMKEKRGWKLLCRQSTKI